MRYSGCFWNFCRDPPYGPGQRVFHWPDERPDTFARFIAWMAGKGLTKHPDQDRFNLGLYGLASRLGVPFLMNDLMEAFRTEFLTYVPPHEHEVSNLYADVSMSQLQKLNAWLCARQPPLQTVSRTRSDGCLM